MPLGFVDCSLCLSWSFNTLILMSFLCLQYVSTYILYIEVFILCIFRSVKQAGTICCQLTHICTFLCLYVCLSLYLCVFFVYLSVCLHTLGQSDQAYSQGCNVSPWSQFSIPILSAIDSGGAKMRTTSRENVDKQILRNTKLHMRMFQMT